jgi:superfamily I DNA/RNA helicase
MSAAQEKTNLNPAQHDAATRLWSSSARALQVIAGAGSGKTSTLIAAVDEAVRSGINPERIAILTFSRRAAHELKDRLAQRTISIAYCGSAAIASRF